MTEADITVDPSALRVGTAEGQMISHRFEQRTVNRRAVQVDDADDPTHGE
jgi:hypothetical protein